MKKHRVSREEKVLLSAGGITALVLLLHAAVVDPRSRMNPDLLLDAPTYAPAPTLTAERAVPTAKRVEAAPAYPRTFARMERPHPVALLTPVRLEGRMSRHP